MSEPVTHCVSCGTHWSDCDVLDGGQCAACLRKEVERLRAELAEITELHVRVMEERCATDERHCTCVPMLRGEIGRLLWERDQARVAAARIAREHVDDFQSACGWLNEYEWLQLEMDKLAAAAAGGGDE